jgi:hypothetical protein
MIGRKALSDESRSLVAALLGMTVRCHPERSEGSALALSKRRWELQLEALTCGNGRPAGEQLVSGGADGVDLGGAEVRGRA